MQGEGDKREGAAPRVGGAQLVSGEPSLSTISATPVTQVRVSCLIFTLVFAHTRRGVAVGPRRTGCGGEWIPRRNPSPRSGVML